MSGVDQATQLPEAPAPVLVTSPADGVPAVIDTPAALADAVTALLRGSGPMAIDTERAQSYRYSAKAYLIQLRRTEAGSFLIDPVALEQGRERADLSALAEATADVEWILHAAGQDLPCLAEVRLLPRTLFDTELAGRLLGLPRVSLSALTELGLHKKLAKEHSAVDWSKRPLPQEWLNYAVLDVELLAELRDWIACQLVTAGKDEWARQEFEYLAARAADPVVRREDPWRRTSGIHELRTPLQLAIVRELWQARDAIAQQVDRAPSRVLPDLAISELAGRLNPSNPRRLGQDDLRSVKGFGWRIAARHQDAFLAALDRTAALTREELPSVNPPQEGPPPPRSWAKLYPEAHQRWSRIRPATVELAARLTLPVENLISPDALRRLAFEPPWGHTETDVDAFLAGRSVRPWQRELVVPLVAPLLG